jgi:hypothetical protein
VKEIELQYRKLGNLVKANAKSDDVIELIMKIHKNCLDFISDYQRTDLISKIQGKNYFVFKSNGKQSRAVNSELFVQNYEFAESVVNSIIKNDFKKTNPEEITKALYSIAISFCSSIDLLKRGDQKTPGTYFEYFVTHWFAKMLQINPRKQVDVLNLDMSTSLPTDCIFDLGTNRPKIHLPVKTSTRERVIQVWAHQRVLDGVYGTGRFLGFLVCLSETKVDHVRMEVVEICLPDQWRLYQMFIAQMKRIYYLDVPTRYLTLNEIFPPIHVRPFGEFFYEIGGLVEGRETKL